MLTQIVKPDVLNVLLKRAVAVNVMTIKEKWVM